MPCQVSRAVELRFGPQVIAGDVVLVRTIA